MDLSQSAVFATLSWQKAPPWSFQASLGVILDGQIQPDKLRAQDVATGGALSIGASWLAFYEKVDRPFVQLAWTLGVSSTSAISDDRQSHRLTAVDLRFGILVGKTYLDRLTLFVAGRTFAGPVFWTLAGESVIGGDAYHLAFGAGAVLRLAAGIDVFAEGMGLGERSFSVGTAIAF